MTQDQLIHRYDVEPNDVEVIPHGADALFAGPSLVTGSRPLVLTWGLIGPGKGLETVIEAFADLVELEPRPRYLIAGATHPNVRASSGESYREGLFSLVRRLGLEDMIEFDNRYLDRKTLARLVRSADMVVLPYASVEQVIRYRKAPSSGLGNDTKRSDCTLTSTPLESVAVKERSNVPSRMFSSRRY